MGKKPNLGELCERISVLSIVKNENSYLWEEAYKVWAKSELLTGNNLFSQVGIGAKSVKFIIRKNRNLSLHNAFRWNGKHCFITSIADIKGAYCEVIVALVEPQVCTIKRVGEPKKNELNRPIYGESKNIVFPACMIEKYIGHTQNDPMAVTEVRYVIVTPKEVELEAGELVMIRGYAYHVLILHLLDEYKNEYEVEHREAL